ncbi:MAG: VCBS repeat-containing protein [Verrucomicrobiota bacterium]
MTKKTLLVASLTALLVCVVVIALVVIGQRRESVTSTPRPWLRPARPDLALLERFQDQSTVSAVETLLAEFSDNPMAPPVAEDPIALLPDAAVPFGSGVESSDPEKLRAWVTEFAKDVEANPDASDRVRMTAALSALDADLSQIPEKLLYPLPEEAESLTYSTRLDLQLTTSGSAAALIRNPAGGADLLFDGGRRLASAADGGQISESAVFDGLALGSRLKVADYNDDGFDDFLQLRPRGLPLSLIAMAPGDGSVVDATLSSGLRHFGDTTDAAWLDLDHDGKLDLVVASRDRPVELYLQEESGRFGPFAWESRFWIPQPVVSLVVADLNGDRFDDLIVARQDGVREAFVTTGKRDRPLSPIAIPFLSHPGPLQGCAADFDQDGDIDLALAYGSSSGIQAEDGLLLPTLQLLFAEPDGLLIDGTLESGTRLTDPVTALAAIDVDNDGYPDLAVGTAAPFPNRFYSNRGAGQFRDVSATIGFSYLDEPIDLFSGDLDRDGAADLIAVSAQGVVKRFEASGDRQDWIAFNCSGGDRPAIVEITTRDPDWVVEKRSVQAQPHESLLIGLGSVDKIELLEVTPIGSDSPVLSAKQLDPNRYLQLQLVQP